MMEIAGVLTAGKFLSTALGQLARRCQPKGATAGPPTESAAPSVAGAGGATSAFRQIAARYDVTEISPRDFSQMIQELHDAGQLTDQQFQELSQVRVELDSARVEPDEAVDLVDFCLEQLRQFRESMEDRGGLLSAGERSRLGAIGRRLEWMEKFAAIQSTDDEVGMDALA
jgi:hypothetical protein